MKTNLSGILELPFVEYQAIDAINKTGLDHIERSPAHYQAYLKSPPPATDAMILGQAVHHGVFEPELLYKQFFARPDGIDGRTKEGKEKLSELGKANVGKTMLKADDFAMVEGIMRAARSHKVVSRLISGGMGERTAVAQDAEHGVLCKARADYMTEGDALIDLKTSSSVDFRSFQRSVVNFRYHVQAAWYLDVVNAAVKKQQFKRFLLVAVEKEFPYGLMIYEMDRAAIDLGRKIARANLHTFVECKKTGIWPGYPDELQIMTIPEWA